MSIPEKASRRNFLRMAAAATTVTVLARCGQQQPDPKPPAIERQTKQVPTDKAETPVPRPRLRWGIFTGTPEGDEQFERGVGRPAEYTTRFIGWHGETLPPKGILEQAREGKKEIIFFWEAHHPDRSADNDPQYACQRILEGVHDRYIQEFAAKMAEYGGRVILFPFPEPNGNWTPQSITINDNSRDSFVAALTHVADFFRNIPNVRIGLALNNTSIPSSQENTLDAYNPGPLVKVVGLDGFNFGPPQQEWRSFGEIFDPALATVSSWGPEVIISSVSCAPGEKRPAWIQDAFRQMVQDPNIVGFNWFGENKEGKGLWERNWSLSDPPSFRAFKEALSESASLDNPRE